MTAPNTTDAPTIDDADTDVVDTAADSTDTTDQSATDALGDAGKKALDAMKAKWRSERDRAKALEAQIADAAKPADDKPDLDALRTQARAEVLAESMRERALDKLEAKAARLFQNPEDARAFLADKVDDFIDGTSVDTDAITDALKELLDKRPYLGVTQGEPKRFQGTADGGAKGTAGKPQLTEADVKRLSKEGRHAEIEAARIDGRLNTLLGIT